MKTLLLLLTYLYLTCFYPAQAQPQPAAQRKAGEQLPARYAFTPLSGLPQNYECEEKGTQALAINNRGQIVGQSWERPVMWQNGKLRVLPLLPGDNVGAAFAVNKQGDVLIHSERRDNQQAALWRNGRLLRLGTLGGRESHAVAINATGQIIGYSTISPDALGGMAEHPFVWQNGRMRDLGVLPGYTSGHPTAINRRGQVVGFCYNGPSYHHDAPFRDQRAFLWANGKMQDLGALPGDKCSRAEGINNRGQIIGESARNTAPKYEGHAVTWQNGHIRGLSEAGGGKSRATHINDQGDIAGLSPQTPKGFWQTALWRQGKMQALAAPENTDVVDVRGLDEQGHIYLLAWPASKPAHAYLWQNGVYTRLPLIPPADANSPTRAAAEEGRPDIQSVTGTGRVLFTIGGDLLLFQEGQTRRIPPLPQIMINSGINALAANDAGDIIGDTKPTYWRIQRDFLLRQGKIVPFATRDPKLITNLFGLNDIGQVIGQQNLAPDVAHDDPLRQTFVPRGFVWQNGKTNWLNDGISHSFVVTPSAINNRGQIAGIVTVLDPRGSVVMSVETVLWENGKTCKLKNLTLTATAINDAGLIVGRVHQGTQTEGDEPRAADYEAPAVWQKGKHTQLTSGRAFDYNSARAVNQRGQVVGDTNAGAFVWQAGKMLFLANILPPASGRQSTATGINDRGQIIGATQRLVKKEDEKGASDYVKSAFLLTPKS